MKFTREITINSHDLYPNGTLRPSALLREMMETSSLCAEAEHPSMDELRAAGYHFVVSRTALSVYGEVRKYEPLTVETWAAQMGGAFSYGRCFRLMRGSTPIVETASIFALLDSTRGRPVRYGEVEMHYCSDKPLELDMPTHLILPPKDCFTLAGEHIVTLSETDENHHMNNTRYADLLCDFLPAPETHRVVRMSLSYLCEAKRGETLKLYRAKGDDGAFFFRTVRSDGKTNLEAEIITDRIEEG